MMVETFKRRVQPMSRKRKISLISLVIILVLSVGSAYFAVAGILKTIDKGYVPIKMIIMKRKIKIVNRFDYGARQYN